MNDIIIRTENLCYYYEDEHEHALDQLTLEIKRGKKIAVMGANGSGKSTFFLCCNGIHKPTSGAIYFNEKPIQYTKKELLNLRHKVGIVFQDPDIQLFSSSVYQEISFGPLNMGMSEDETKVQVEQVMEQLGITPFRNKPTHALSGGQKKQVSIADILVMKPELIILDEPTAALDPKHTSIVNDIINQLSKQGTTVMIATHDVNYAIEWADEVLLFHEGRLLKSGSPLEIFQDLEALNQSNLEQPMVIQMFEHLQEKGLLSTDAKQPHSMDELMNCI